MSLWHVFANNLSDGNNHDCIAIQFPEENISLTYSNLFDQCCKLEVVLASRLQMDDRVGVICECPLRRLIIMLTLFKRNAMYVPFSSLVCSQIELTRVNAIISDNPRVGFTCLDEGVFFSRLRKDHIVLPRQISYVVTTSGTTSSGTPVAVSTSSILSNLFALQKALDLQKRCIIPNVSAATFDPYFIEVFLAFLCQGTVLLLSKSARLQPNVLFNILIRSYTTLLMATPALFARFDQTQIEFIITSQTSIKKLILGGESFPIHLFADKGRIAIDVYNIYGTTECSVWGTLQKLGFSSDFSNGIPIGKPLEGTELQLRPFDDVLYEILLGGQDRQCFIHDEVEAQMFRSTGDLAKVDASGNIVLVGRIDNQYKRFGVRFNLTAVQAMVSEKVYARFTSSYMDSDSNLIALIWTPKRSLDDLKNELLKLIQSPEIPDVLKPDVFLVSFDDPSLTTHGKIDECRSSNRFVEIQTKDLFHVRIPAFDSSNHLSWLVGILCQVFPKATIADEKIYFFQTGASSMDALRFSQIVSKSLQYSDEWQMGFFKAVLHEPFGKLVDYIQQQENSGRDSNLETIKRRRLSNNIVSLNYSIPMGKCVDGSPVVRGSSCFVASHSGLVIKFDIVSGEKIWSTNIGCRIESTCGVDDSGQVVVIGGYDGRVFVMNGRTGSICHTYEHVGPIKARPIVTRNTIVTVGHDGIVYGINYHMDKEGCLVLKKLGEVSLKESVSSSPLYLNGNLFISTLSGSVYCVDGLFKIQWKADLSQKPIFAEPVHLNNDLILVTCVDGSVTCICSTSGSLRWKIHVCNAPIFSQATVTKNGFLVVTHSKELFSFKLLQGSFPVLEWSCNYPAALTSTPRTLPGTDQIVAISIDGQLKIINQQNGRELDDFKFNGEVFSSPEIVRISAKLYLIVGCRDDNVHVLNISI